MKGSVDLETVREAGLVLYAQLCGAALGQAHARAAAVAPTIAGYLGGGDSFDRAIASFAADYADQTERDHEALVRAAESGRITATTGL